MTVAHAAFPALSALVVNYNTAALTKNCVASLQAQTVSNPVSGATGVEVIVVDNASRPEERQALAELAARLVFNENNRGYGGALNQALALAQGECVLFSNSDTWYFPGALQVLLDSLQRLPRCGAVGPRLWWDREREFLLPPSDPVTPMSVLCDIFFRQGPWTAGWVKHWRRQALSYWQARTPLVQPLLSGACLLTHKSIISACGGFDERFHLYYEDTDWCRRVRGRGYHLYYVPAADVAHLYNQSARQAEAVARQAGAASWEYYFRKHYGPQLWRFLALMSQKKRPAERRPNAWTSYTDLGELATPPVFSFPSAGEPLPDRFLVDDMMRRHSRESGNPEKGGQLSKKKLDARLRGHDEILEPDGLQSRNPYGLDEGPTHVRGKEGSYLLQLSPQGDCLPAIARFSPTPRLSLSPTVWEQLAEGEFFAQLLLLPRLQLAGKWRWRKTNTSSRGM